jgi:hypothetical protein
VPTYTLYPATGVDEPLQVSDAEVLVLVVVKEFVDVGTTVNDIGTDILPPLYAVTATVAE